jgi:hypothetical protein
MILFAAYCTIIHLLLDRCGWQEVMTDIYNHQSRKIVSKEPTEEARNNF